MCTRERSHLHYAKTYAQSRHLRIGLRKGAVMELQVLAIFGSLRKSTVRLPPAMEGWPSCRIFT